MDALQENILGTARRLRLGSRAEDVAALPADRRAALETLARAVARREALAAEGHARRVGPYLLLEEIGRGGMGVVHRAIDPRVGRTCALKLLAEPLERSGSFAERFMREARAAALLAGHPNVVPIYELGEDAGRPYLAMAYVAGRSLDQVLADGPLAPSAAADVARKVALALDHAHRHGLIHRDVKPSNVLMDGGFEPIVTDFGLAFEAAAVARLSAEGALIGTPAYMAPEQARDGGGVDARSDVYSLGTVLYHCLAGEPPFASGSLAAILAKVQTERPPSLAARCPTAPRDLVVIAEKCIEKDPARRYASAAALASDLEAFLAGRPIAARPPSLVGELVRAVRRRRAPVLTAAAALLGGAAMAGVFIRELQRERDAAAAAEMAARSAAARARDREKLAQDTLRILIYEVRDGLANVPGERVRRVRKELLERALAGLEELRAAEPEPAGPSLAAAEAERQIATLARDVGRLDLADEALGRAEDIARAAPPSEHTLAKITDLARLRAQNDEDRGEMDRAMERLRRAEALVRAFLEREPGNAARRSDLANLLEDEACWYGRLARYREGIEKTESAIALERSLLSEAPGERTRRYDLAGALVLLVEARLRLLDLDGAREPLEEALSLVRGLGDEPCNKKDPRRLLLMLLDRRSRLERDAGRFEAALRACDESIAIARRLLASEPGSAEEEALEVSTLLVRGDILRQWNRPREAIKAFEQSEAAARKALEQDPESVTLMGTRADALHEIGMSRFMMQDERPARRAFDQAIALYREAYERSGHAVEPAEKLGCALEDLAAVHRASGRVKSALEALREAEALYAGPAKTAVTDAERQRVRRRIERLEADVGDPPAAR